MRFVLCGESQNVNVKSSRSGVIHSGLVLYTWGRGVAFVKRQPVPWGIDPSFEVYITTGGTWGVLFKLKCLSLLTHWHPSVLQQGKNVVNLEGTTFNFVDKQKQLIKAAEECDYLFEIKYISCYLSPFKDKGQMKWKLNYHLSFLWTSIKRLKMSKQIYALNSIS